MLWRVEVAGISHRFVDAETKDAAEELVMLSVVRSLDIRAAPASKPLADAYEQAGPIRRKSMLAAMDGLTSPRSQHQVRRDRNRLERLLRWEQERNEWVQRQVAKAPQSPDPAILERIIKASEVSHIESNLNRLRAWEAHSHLHDEL